MGDLAEFLLARIDDDEAVAHAAMQGFTTGQWTRDGGSVYAGHPTAEVVDWVYNEAWGHIARHDPARVLAECEAKRRIVSQYEFTAAALRQYRKSEPTMRAVNEIERVLRALALPYADHPDYSEDWRS